jgi:hypothetical protein
MQPPVRAEADAPLNLFARPIEVEDGGPKEKTRACYAYRDQDV